MNFIKYLSFCLVFGAFFVIQSTPPLHAQIIPSINGLQVTINPSIPQPGQKVNVEITDYSVDLDAAVITWYQNGKVVSEEIGQRTFSLTAPQSGKVENIKVVAKTVGGPILQKSFDIKSSSIEIILESNGYVPPFFIGKAPIAYQNKVNIIAIPHLLGKNGIEIDPAQLIYRWTVDSKFAQSASGYGKQVFQLEQNVIAKPYEITVNVTPRDGSAETQSSIKIDSVDPSIAFYIEDPLYGVMYNKMADSISRFYSREARITAVPFGWNSDEMADSDYSWEIGGETRPELGKNRSVILRVKDDSISGSEIALDMRNNVSILQGAKNSFGVIFSNQTSTSTSF